jgi:hypothetical protein
LCINLIIGKCVYSEELETHVTWESGAQYSAAFIASKWMENVSLKFLAPFHLNFIKYLIFRFKNEKNKSHVIELCFFGPLMEKVVICWNFIIVKIKEIIEYTNFLNN